MSDRDDLAKVIAGVRFKAGTRLPQTVLEQADAILAAGYRKPRQVTTRAEANALPDRSAILTPGEIIFRKWENYYGAGKHAWERELGKMVIAEDLSEDGHFPATILHEPTP